MKLSVGRIGLEAYPPNHRVGRCRIRIGHVKFEAQLHGLAPHPRRKAAQSDPPPSPKPVADFLPLGANLRQNLIADLFDLIRVGKGLGGIPRLPVTQPDIRPSFCLRPDIRRPFLGGGAPDKHLVAQFGLLVGGKSLRAPLDQETTAVPEMASNMALSARISGSPSPD